MNWWHRSHVGRGARFLLCVGVACAIACYSAHATDHEGSTPIVYQGQGDEMQIALTFDDGPHPLYTAEILDILAQYGIPATFFVIGENADLYPEMLQRTVAEGHEIGNHTQTHPLKNLTREQMEEEMANCETTIAEWIDFRPRLFRPPGGILSDTVTALAEDHRYRVILWSIDTRDWAHTPVDQITKTVLNEIGAGDIILMHDGIKCNSPTPQALRILIPILLDRGYRFVTVSELLGEM
jgi:peptidoglycan/xylan/chitin deacetylase (PgdA/CDA1 family)